MADSITPKLHMMLPVDSHILDKDFIKKVERGVFIADDMKEEIKNGYTENLR